jgi:hypothetical protein
VQLPPPGLFNFWGAMRNQLAYRRDYSGYSGPRATIHWASLLGPGGRTKVRPCPFCLALDCRRSPRRCDGLAHPSGKDPKPWGVGVSQSSKPRSVPFNFAGRNTAPCFVTARPNSLDAVRSPRSGAQSAVIPATSEPLASGTPDSRRLAWRSPSRFCPASWFFHNSPDIGKTP